MTPKTLRFRARGSALVQNHERLEARIKSFVGRKFVELKPGVDLPPDATESRWAFTPTGTDEQVAYRAEYVKACKDGDLWPADAETAAACGVPFDPKFGEAAEPASKPAAKPAEKG